VGLLLLEFGRLGLAVGLVARVARLLLAPLLPDLHGDAPDLVRRARALGAVVVAAQPRRLVADLGHLGVELLGEGAEHGVVCRRDHALARHAVERALFAFESQEPGDVRLAAVHERVPQALAVLRREPRRRLGGVRGLRVEDLVFEIVVGDDLREPRQLGRPRRGLDSF